MTRTDSSCPHRAATRTEFRGTQVRLLVAFLVQVVQAISGNSLPSWTTWAWACGLLVSMTSWHIVSRLCRRDQPRVGESHAPISITFEELGCPRHQTDPSRRSTTGASNSDADLVAVHLHDLEDQPRDRPPDDIDPPRRHMPGPFMPRSTEWWCRRAWGIGPGVDGCRRR